ncbi:MAG: glycosyltransferase family 1 protein [Polyangiaceae bacterium]|nr:glycosyltransferase family 1 protein [Polyangiaceae bacterium]
MLPYLALGRRLLAAGHEAWLCSADKYAAEAKARGLPFVSCWPWSDERQRERIEALLAEPDPARHLDIIYGRSRKDIVASVPAVVDATSRAELIISHSLAIGGYAASRRHGTPLVTGHLFDGIIPSASMSPFGVNLGPLNRALWAMVRRMVRQKTDPVFNEALASVGLPPERDIFFSTGHSRLLNLVATSPAVCRLSPLTDRAYQLTGFWFDDDETEPDPALAAFVEAGPPPLVIGFGSMTGIDAREWTRRVVEGVGRRRAVLQMGWANLGDVELPPNIFRAGVVSHRWLFPRASGVIHHGGAGTTAAVMRAGVPSAVVWFLGDQPTWGKRIARLGIGPPATRFSRFSASWLDRTLQQLTSDQQMRARAAELAARIRAEDGLGEAVAAIDRLAASLGR